MKKILITGGTGLVGRKLSKLLAENSYEVRILTRDKNKKSDYKLFTWDYENNYIDEDALKDIDVIIHLAGANIGEKRWTKSRKKEIISSRVNSAEFLYNKIAELKKSLRFLFLLQQLDIILHFLLVVIFSTKKVKQVITLLHLYASNGKKQQINLKR